jgi:transcription-repair coupling factor (superfamily II helicase)
MSASKRYSPFSPPLPKLPGERLKWRCLHGSGFGLAVSSAVRTHTGPVVLIVSDTATAHRLEDEIRFFSGTDESPPLLHFSDWETLPYDIFSPHQDIVSERLAALYRLPNLVRGILIVPVITLMARLAPRSYLEQNSLMLQRGAQLSLEDLKTRLIIGGYRAVGQVMEHGEFAVRGSLLDLYPMGSELPYRLDFLDEEVDSIRTFDPEGQRSIAKLDEVNLLPAREFPLTEDSIAHFRRRWRANFSGDPTLSPLYQDVSQGLAPAGIEYYLPLFFDHFDYLPSSSLVIADDAAHAAAEAYWRELNRRYEQRRHNLERPLLPPVQVFLPTQELFHSLGQQPQVVISSGKESVGKGECEFATQAPGPLPIDNRTSDPIGPLARFLKGFSGRTLFVAETPGRRESLLETFHYHHLQPRPVPGWSSFLGSDSALGMTVAPLEQGAIIDVPPVAIITESQLFGERAMQRRRRKSNRDAESIIRELTELKPGTPVVHEQHGIGRYVGLETLRVGDLENEFLTLEYGDGDKLYVPVAALQLVTRYAGGDPQLAPLHKLGSPHWQKIRKKAAERIYDVAVELLDVQARRAVRAGHAFPLDDEQYRTFVRTFPFEETADQQSAIDDVLHDMTLEKTMDRLVCGDVGFGKTEVAMRAAFVAVMAGHQVAVLVPTTLLAQQHYQNFSDRFADWPIKIEQLSRFQSKKEQEPIIRGLKEATTDIVIGTHRLLQGDVQFKKVGLVIVDEEHRFGVRQKERLKALRAEADVLTLTATPIPRTLNMALAGLRDLSLIATPPERRLSIKTFVRQWDDELLREACLREIRRGGQVYFVHNKVEDIEKLAQRVQGLVPEASVRIAHGQMRERALEHVMLDFYHRRFNILVCTTIIETGIDVPNANTIIIHRADRFGLAQLHQLRGRVGRSHHRAYAYLVVPARRAMTADAVKRLEAIEALEDLGIGFSLATHDLEIRGAGELLGEEQSGQIQEIGYALYTDLLERAVRALKSGASPDLERPLDQGTEIDLRISALIPEDYLPDIHARLIMYKRIASAQDLEALHGLQSELIDRCGPLPVAAKSLFQVTQLKLKAASLGIRKIDLGKQGGRIVFHATPNIDPARIISLIQNEPQTFRLEGGDRLRITLDLPDAESRIRTLHDLLDTMGSRHAA